MLLLNIFTLDKNNKRLASELSTPSRDLIILTKLQQVLEAAFPEQRWGHYNLSGTMCCGPKPGSQNRGLTTNLDPG